MIRALTPIPSLRSHQGMRPVREIDPEFLAPDEAFTDRLPLLDEWLSRFDGARPLAGWTMLLVQHQLSNQIPMLHALIVLGLEPDRICRLDIPYTSNAKVRQYATQAAPRAALSRTTLGKLPGIGVRRDRRTGRGLRAKPVRAGEIAAVRSRPVRSGGRPGAAAPLSTSREPWLWAMPRATSLRGPCGKPLPCVRRSAPRPGERGLVA